MNNNEQLIERLKRVANIEPGCFLGERCSMHEIAQDAIAALSQGAERIEFERNLTFKYEKLSAELQSRIEGLEAKIAERKQRSECNETERR